MEKKLLPLLVPSLLISMMLHCSDDDFRAKDIRPLVKIAAEDTHELEKVEEIHLNEAESSLIGKITSIQIASNGNIYINGNHPANYTLRRSVAGSGQSTCASGGCQLIGKRSASWL